LSDTLPDRPVPASGFRDAGGFRGDITTLQAALPDEAPPPDPKQALLTGRARYLDDADILALTLEIVTASARSTSRSPEILAGTLLERFGSAAGTLSASEQALAGVSQLGRHVVPGLRLLQEAALRYNRARLDASDILSNPQTLLDYLTARLARESVEQFRIVFLDARGALLADEAQARGTVNHTPVYPREVARRAMELNAAKIVLVHNHPSGDPTPSEADFQMTTMVRNAADTIGVEVVDHLIIGNGRHVSFRELGAL
jgi:DNA repair protein RadC